MNQAALGKCKIFASMFIFGTIGIFVRHIAVPSQILAMVRGVVGVLFLLCVVLLRGGRIEWFQVKKNRLWLLLSGAALGFNWIFLFEAYRYTSVAVSTLCYYLAPIMVVLVSPFLLKERLTLKKCICVFLALLGMFFISGILSGGLPSYEEIRGILYGLSAAVLYASIVLMNKRIKDISAFDKTILQLGISALILLPYCLLTTDLSALNWGGSTIPMLLFVGVVHTGLAYLLYFGAMDYVSAQTAAMISYVDPAIAVLASVWILKEPMSLMEGLGAVLIIGAALMSEITLPNGRKKRL